MKTTRLAAFLVVCAVAATGAGAAVSAPGDQASATAGGGSIVYVKGGKLWVARPDGRVKRRVPHAGTFEWPSQADNGTIVAQRGIYFHRLSRQRQVAQQADHDSVPDEPDPARLQRPVRPEVSPDGTKIAYSYSFVASHFDPGCMCILISPSLNTSYTPANRFEESPDLFAASTRTPRGSTTARSWHDAAPLQLRRRRAEQRGRRPVRRRGRLISHVVQRVRPAATTSRRCSSSASTRAR